MHDPSATSDRPRVEIGGVARAHGIRGEVVVVTHDPDSTVLDAVERIYVDGIAYAIAGARATPKGWLVALEGIVDRNAAERLRGKPVEVARDDLALEDGDVLLADLVGCAVQRVSGEPWGTIVAIDAGPGQDLLVIHDGEVERLLPLVDAFVVGIDVAARRVTVDPPDGLPTSPIVHRA